MCVCIYTLYTRSGRGYTCVYDNSVLIFFSLLFSSSLMLSLFSFLLFRDPFLESIKAGRDGTGQDGMMRYIRARARDRNRNRVVAVYSVATRPGPPC